MVCVKHSTSSILFLAGHGSGEEVTLCFLPVLCNVGLYPAQRVKAATARGLESGFRTRVSVSLETRLQL